MNIKEAIAKAVDRLDLSREEMSDVMRQIMTGQCDDAQIAGFLVALRMKSESIDEITGAVEVMRELVTPVEVNAEPMVDIVGTGGDGANLFNVSSAATFVTAAAGVHVAKHGGRAVSSSSGSADLLEQAGINLNAMPANVARCIEEVGVGFMFAPNHHSAMKYAVPARKALGIRTLFNILGPMTNPAGVKRQVIGVFNKALCRPVAEVLHRLGSEHVLVVHAKDGLDEISLATSSYVAELKDGEIREYEITPEQLGVPSRSLVGLEVDGSAESLALIKDAFAGKQDERSQKAADTIALNAGAAIYVAGLADNFADGVDQARTLIANGAALDKLQQLAQFSQSLEN